MESNLRTFLRKAGSVGLDTMGLKGQVIKLALNKALPEGESVPEDGKADDLLKALDSLAPEAARLVTKQLNKEPEIKKINKQELKESVQQILSSLALTLIDKHGGFKNPYVAGGVLLVVGVLSYFGWL